MTTKNRNGVESWSFSLAAAAWGAFMAAVIGITVCSSQSHAAPRCGRALDYVDTGLSTSGGTMTGDLKFGDDVQSQWGSSSDTICEWDTAVTPDAMVCGIGADSRVWYFAEAADVGTDWAKAQQTNPTLCVQSADATSTTDRLCLTHDQTNAVLSSDAGAVVIRAASGVVTTAGQGGSNNEDLSCDHETTPDTIACTSSTGVATITYGPGITSSGTVEGATVTDGTATLTSDTLTAGTITDGTATLTGGDLSGAGTVTATTLTDGTMSSTAGAISGATTIDATVDVEVSAATGGLIKTTDTTTPGDAAGAGVIEVHAEDDATNDHVMGKLEVDVTSAATGAEYADWVCSSTTNGVDATEYWRTDASAGTFKLAVPIEINGGDTADAGDLRMTNSGQICWESSPPGVDKCVYVNSTAAFYIGTNAIVISEMEAQSSGSSAAYLLRSTANPPGDDFAIGKIYTRAFDSGGGGANYYNYILFYVEEDQAGDEDGSTVFSVMDNGTPNVKYLKLDATDGIESVVLSKPLVHDTQVAASPAAPRTCDATALGTVQAVNDSDDGAGTEVCYCGMTDDSTYDWLDMSDNTACSHY
jgi:hypothetical protein